MSGLHVPSSRGDGKRRPTTPIGLEKVPPRERNHLSKNSSSTGGFKTKRDNEWYCSECRSRVTVSPDGEREFGHARVGNRNGPCEIVTDSGGRSR